MPKFYLNKIVRDDIFDEYSSDPTAKVDHKILAGDELIRKLAEKVVEEAGEIASVVSEQTSESMDLDKLTSEIADLKEVLIALYKRCGINEEAVETKRQEKLTKKGGFNKGAYILSLELPEDHEWTEYFHSDSKYKKK